MQLFANFGDFSQHMRSFYHISTSGLKRDVIFEFNAPVFTRTWLGYVRVFAIANPSVVCNVRLPYSRGWNFWQHFFAILYLSHLLTSVENFTEIVHGEPPVEGVRRKRGSKIERCQVRVSAVAELLVLHRYGHFRRATPSSATSVTILSAHAQNACVNSTAYRKFVTGNGLSDLDFLCDAKISPVNQRLRAIWANYVKTRS